MKNYFVTDIFNFWVVKHAWIAKGRSYSRLYCNPRSSNLEPLASPRRTHSSITIFNFVIMYAKIDGVNPSTTSFRVF